MLLFINPLSSNISLALLEEGSLIEKHIIPRGDDFSSFPEKVIELIGKGNINEIWCILGPGAFTRMRIVTLTVNTLHLSKGMVIKGCHFFDLIENHSIPLLEANTSEYITKDSEGNITLREKESLPAGTYSGYSTKNDFTDGKVFIEYSEDYEKISALFQDLPSEKILSPIYFKNPHITWSKKNISPSSKKMSMS